LCSLLGQQRHQRRRALVREFPRWIPETILHTGLHAGTTVRGGPHHLVYRWRVIILHGEIASHIVQHRGRTRHWGRAKHVSSMWGGPTIVCMGETPSVVRTAPPTPRAPADIVLRGETASPVVLHGGTANPIVLHGGDAEPKEGTTELHYVTTVYRIKE